MKYMLDTNIIVYINNHLPEMVLRHFRQMDPADMCISSITLAELEYGVYKSARPEQNQLALSTSLINLVVMPFDEEAALKYGRIRAALERRGQPIGANDMLIAAHAKALNLTLVTNNTREFERVDGLQIENWT